MQPILKILSLCVREKLEMARGIVEREKRGEEEEEEDEEEDEN